MILAKRPRSDAVAKSCNSCCLKWFTQHTRILFRAPWFFFANCKAQLGLAPNDSFFPCFNYFCGQSTLPQPHFDLLHVFLIRDKHASGAILQLFLSVGSQVVLLSCFLRTGLARLFQANWNYPLNSLGSVTINMLKFSHSPCQRPHHVEYTSSRPITEVKQHWA